MDAGCAAPRRVPQFPEDACVPGKSATVDGAVGLGGVVVLGIDVARLPVEEQLRRAVRAEEVLRRLEIFFGREYLLDGRRRHAERRGDHLRHVLVARIEQRERHAAQNVDVERKLDPGGAAISAVATLFS